MQNRATSFLLALSTLMLFCWQAAMAAEPTQPEAEVLENLPGPIRLVLPPDLYAVPGIETNVYFDNVMLAVNPANYTFDVICPRGRQQCRRWTYTPAVEDVGSCEFRLEVRDQLNALVASARSTLSVVPPDTGVGRAVSMLLVGDSLTHASVYSQHLLDLCAAPGNPKLTLIGSHNPEAQPEENRHEGYGGWTAKRFATHYTETARQGDYAKRGSPFIYLQADGSKKLDFARYCKDLNQGQVPDFVTIFLGPNDIFRATEETIEAEIDVMLEHYDMLIRMVHSTHKQTRVGVMLPAPPAGTQDAFGANYRCGQTRWQYKRNQHRLVERMLKRYGQREKDGIHLVPVHVNLDCLHNYPAQDVQWNAHTEATGRRLSNGVHPAPAGYQQIGDSLYAWLKAELSAP